MTKTRWRVGDRLRRAARGAGWLCGLVLAAEVWAAQERAADAKGAATQPAASRPAESGDRECRGCHGCDRPTAEDRCLRSCLRPRASSIPTQPAEAAVPDVVILKELEKIYLPVPFDHNGHARMAQMGQGCVMCHHYTPAGQRHPACKTCHDLSKAGTDIRKPGLKGAYHRQCLNCHREWIDETACAICHMPKTIAAVAGEAAVTPTKDDILAHMDSAIPEPETEVYRTRSTRPAETQVVFRHREHVRRFGLGCVECHHEESCTRCHSPEKSLERPRTLAEHHQPCVKCHDRDMPETATTISGPCERCHWRPGQAPVKPFDHASTGWSLSRYHERRGCRDCHKAVPFGPLPRDCNACHAGWSPSTFDHRVTGQTLDDNHAVADCDVCHVDRKFDRPPTCDQCHDKDSGVTFPAKRPGPVAGR